MIYFLTNYSNTIIIKLIQDTFYYKLKWGKFKRQTLIHTNALTVQMTTTIGYYPTRREMIDYLIIQYPQYFINEDYQTKLFLLNSDIKCPCTDCGGNDSIIECKIEKRYYEFINNPIVSL